MPAYGELAVFTFEYLLGVGHLVETEFLGHLRAYLGGVSVDGLTASDDHVHISYLLDCRGKRI